MTTMNETTTSAICPNCGRDAICDTDGFACPVCDHGEFENVLCNMRRPTREEIAADDIREIADGTRWAVLDLNNRYREDGQIPDPEILYSGLESREAAELARRECIACLLDHGAPYGPSEVPYHFFDLAGRMLRFLRHHNVADAERLACDMAHAEPWGSYARVSASPDPETPF